MYAKKFFSFSSKPFSYISHSFSNFFGFFTVSPTDASDPEFPEQKPEFNFYQIKSQTQKDLRKSYDRWVGKMNLSHNMTEKNPCQQRNCLENRCVSIQFAANNPIQDRITIDQINGLEGYLLNIFDGHGGWQLAEYAMEVFPRKFQKNLSDSHEFSQELGFSLDQIIIDSFERTYDSIEKGFLKIARKAKSMGLLKTGTVGTCALTIFVQDNKLYVASNGECKGFLCSLDKEGHKNCSKINKKLKKALGKEEEKQNVIFEVDSKKKLRKMKKNKIFYLENNLQSARGFGDFSLKYPEFYEEKDAEFNGPKITHRPEIKIMELNENDKFLILGSDGVWEMVKKENLEGILEKSFEDIYTIAENIYNFAFMEICEKNGIEKEELLNKGLGEERRKYHNDISLMVVDLKNQFR